MIADVIQHKSYESIMSVEYFGSSVNWDQLKQLAADKVPVSKWYDDESGELSVTTDDGGDYSDKTNRSFNLLYEALRGELASDHREATDRYFAMFHWWDHSTRKATPVPKKLRTQIIDLKINDDDGIITGVLSPESVKEACSYAAKIDFDGIRQLLDSIYAKPKNWQNSNSIPSDKKSPLVVENWKHQKTLIEFDAYNRFFNVAGVLDHAKTWLEPLSNTAKKDEGFLMTVSY